MPRVLYSSYFCFLFYSNWVEWHLGCLKSKLILLVVPTFKCLGGFGFYFLENFFMRIMCEEEMVLTSPSLLASIIFCSSWSSISISTYYVFAYGVSLSSIVLYYVGSSFLLWIHLFQELTYLNWSFVGIYLVFH